MDPCFVGGGRVKDFVTERNAGNYLTGISDWLVIEACESDGTIVDYRPTHSIILNLSLDHHDIAETAFMFEELRQNTKGLVVTSHDDESIVRFGLDGPINFSIDRKSSYQADSVEYRRFDTVFKVRGQNFMLSLPGKHNLYNAMACVAILSELGVPLNDVAAFLPRFSGIERRFDIHLHDENYLVVDDYAHNPHKIFNLMQTMSRISESVCYIFQPHGYGPTRLLKDGYVETFAGNLRRSDQLFLLPIYFAGGTAEKDISSQDIVDAIAESGGSAALLPERRGIFGVLGRWQSYVIFGARDDSLSDYAEEIASALAGRRSLSPGPQGLPFIRE